MMIVIQTNDGSTTVELPDSGLTYHSKHGAIQESQHVFIDSGLHFYLSNNAKPLIHIFEMGFGTGLNCLLTYKAIQGLPVKISYSTIELHPLPKSVYSTLNYCSNENLNSLAKIFELMHESEWNQPVQLSSSFQLLKIHGDIISFVPPAKYDIIYFDAFAPGSNPDQWTEAIFQKLSDSLNPQSVFVTYSSKVSVRRALEPAGFNVQKIPGPRGKREIVRAIKQ